MHRRVRQSRYSGQFRRKNQTPPTLDLAEEDWNDILETNLSGTLRACQVFGRHMIENGYGRIINIASLSTFVSLFEVAAYSASKAAVASLTKSLAIEWAVARRQRQRDCAGRFPHAFKRKIIRRNRARARIFDAHADAALRSGRRTRRRGDFSGVRRGKLRDRLGAGR